MTTYIALIRKDADSDFGVSFPDFPGCVTAGRTLAEIDAYAETAGTTRSGLIATATRKFIRAA